jgi:hypothetical protein
MWSRPAPSDVGLYRNTFIGVAGILSALCGVASGVLLMRQREKRRHPVPRRVERMWKMQLWCSTLSGVALASTSFNNRQVWRIAAPRHVDSTWPRRVHVAIVRIGFAAFGERDQSFKIHGVKTKCMTKTTMSMCPVAAVLQLVGAHDRPLHLLLHVDLDVLLLHQAQLPRGADASLRAHGHLDDGRPRRHHRGTGLPFVIIAWGGLP